MSGASSRETVKAIELGILAEAIEGEVVGDASLRVTGIRTLDQAGSEELSFVTRSVFKDQAERSSAGALLVPADLAEDNSLAGRPLLVARDPSWALARIIGLFHPVPEPVSGVHPTAMVDATAEVDPSAQIDAYAVIGAQSRIGARVAVGAHSVIGSNCSIGDGTTLHPHVVLYDRTEVGERVVIHAGVVLGADGFGYATRHGEHVKVPQVGHTVIEEDVEIGALSAIDRALLEETRIGAGSKIDNLVQVGHNVHIGRGCLLCGQAGIAGSARLGDYVVLGGQSGAADHVQIAKGVQAAGKSAVLQSIDEEGLQVGGVPAVDLRRWRRQHVQLGRLEKLARRVRVLEKQLEKFDR